MTSLISFLVDFAQNLALSGGYAGVFFVAFLENFFPPLPSELIFPFIGFVAGRGEFSLAGVILAGTFGTLLGAWFWYALGWYLGRVNLEKFFQRFGRIMGIHFSDVERAEAWFLRFRNPVLFFGRLVPLVRTLISIPAGFGKVSAWQFSVLSFAGSLVWISFLSGAGFVLGDNWGRIVPWVQNYEILIEIGLVLAVLFFGFWLYRHRHR
jgi:membrane protein DedA with SNARE-associated domain